MLKRYSREEMSNLWSEEAKFKYWLDVELAGVKAWMKLGFIPQDDGEKILKNAKFDIERIYEIEKDTKHDVIAFLTNVNENLGSESRFMHYGLTSTDCVDSALNLQIKASLEIIMKNLDSFLEILKNKALAYKNTLMIGRSHGIHGEIITFGFVLLSFFDEIRRAKKNLEIAKENISVGMFSGAMGNFTHSSLEFEKLACEFLGLKPAKISSQVISRDLHANVIAQIAILAGICEKIAVEIRHLQRTEVLEVNEFFDINQKGSSAMPHKRNPVLSENITGLCRILRGFLTPALEDIPLWHQRDISHSSVERFMFPDIFITLDFMLARLSNLVDNLIVYEENMIKNINLTGGLIFSQRILLELTKKGISRELAYKIVQRNSMKVWDKLNSGEFLKDKKDLFFNYLLQDKDLKSILTKDELKSMFNYNYYIKNIDEIFKRVLD